MAGAASRQSRVEPEAILAQVTRILGSAPFQTSERRQRFLRYLVEETLAGRGNRLKGYAIAVAVFDRPATFDPAIDPVVRIEAGRLRDKLREYYDGAGRADVIRIELPKGSYAPVIDVRLGAPASELPGATSEQPASPQPSPSAARSEDPAEDVDRSELVGASPLGLAAAKHAFSVRNLALLAAAVLLISAASFWFAGERGAGPPDRPSIAVLPFDNIGHDTRWQRFADGLTEDVITDLSHAKDLKVIARNSTEVYKGKPADLRRVGRELDVAYVLEGSIQPNGDRIRVTAQLIAAASGSHVWSERYDRPSADLFAIQNELTQRITATLVSYQGAVAEAERMRVRRKPPASLTAYETYLLGIEAKHRVTHEGLMEADRLFHKAIELDPHFARAYCGLATVQYYLIDLGLAPSVPEAVRKMSEAAELAVKYDPNDGLSHQTLGMAYGYQGKPQQSLAEFNRAEALAPSDADLLLIIAWSLPTLGEPARAVVLAERALALNPHYPDWYNQGLSYIYFFAERYDQSATYRLLVKEPQALDQAFLAMAYANMGRDSDAANAAGKVKALNAQWIAERYLSEAGGYPDDAAALFVNSARKAGLQDCVPASDLKSLSDLVHTKACDQRRATAG